MGGVGRKVSISQNLNVTRGGGLAGDPGASSGEQRQDLALLHKQEGNSLSK
jgi:hypothetical protein